MNLSTLRRTLLKTLSAMPLDFSTNHQQPLAIPAQAVHQFLQHVHKHRGGTLYRPSPQATRKVINENLRFVYCGIPLAASSSIASALETGAFKDHTVNRRKLTMSGTLEKHAETHGFFWFTLVRNPWSRIVSCYHKKILNANTLGKLALIAPFPGLHPRMPFDQFVEWVGSDAGRDEISDPHWTSQHLILSDTSGLNRCSHVGKVERLSEEINYLSERLGTPISLDRINDSEAMRIAKAHGDYRDYYNTKTKEIIGHRYASDIKTFGYDF